MQAQKFREQVSALRSAHQPQEELASELEALRRDERAALHSVKHEGFNQFLKVYNRGNKTVKPSAAGGSGTALGSTGGGRGGAAVKAELRRVVGAAASTNKAQGAYKSAVCEVVKAELRAALSRGQITKDQFKAIARRATEKVVNTTSVSCPPPPAPLHACAHTISRKPIYSCAQQLSPGFEQAG
jgi:hypothetical protein